MKNWNKLAHNVYVIIIFILDCITLEVKIDAILHIFSQFVSFREDATGELWVGNWNRHQHWEVVLGSWECESTARKSSGSFRSENPAAPKMFLEKENKHFSRLKLQSEGGI